LELVDLNAASAQVELVTTAGVVGFLGQMPSSGCARIPLVTFRSVRIELGTIRVGKLLFSHPDLSRRLIGPRIADLPIDAALQDVLAMPARFRPEEIEDSGLRTVAELI
jgi:hypothetical protein